MFCREELTLTIKPTYIIYIYIYIYIYICYSKTVKPGIWPNPWSVQQFGQIPVSLRDLAKSLKCLGIWPNYWNKEGHIWQLYWTHFRDIVKWQWASFYDKLINSNGSWISRYEYLAYFTLVLSGIIHSQPKISCFLDDKGDNDYSYLYIQYVCCYHYR